MDGGKEVVNVKAPSYTPLEEAHLKEFFTTKETIAVYNEGEKSFAGIVTKISHETDASSVVTNINLTFGWLVEVKGNDLAHVEGGMVFSGRRKKTKDLSSPHKKELPPEKTEMLICCCGKDRDQKLTLSRKPFHVEAIKSIAVEYGIAP